MSMARRDRIVSGLSWLAMLLLACDGGKPAGEAAKAEAAPSKAADDEAIAKRKAAREAEAKQKEEEAAALAAKIDALAVLPEDVPKSLDKACAQMTKSYDGYMRKVLKGDMLTKWETGGNEMQISIFDRECKKTTPKIAACQARALEAMPVELEKELATVMKRCAGKYGGG
jgi:hypothetical protein